MTARKGRRATMTQPTEQQGNQPESSEQPVYQPAPAWAPQFSAAAPATSQRQFHNKRYRNSQWPCHRLRNRLCRSRNKRPARINRNSRAGPMLLPAPTRIRQWPSRTKPSVAQERFGRSSGRLTASQVIETCATILAGVILLGLAWTNPQPYAPVDLLAGLSGAAALIVGVRLPQVRPMLRSWPALWLALGGIILIVAAARYEASLKSMRTIAARIGDLR